MTDTLRVFEAFSGVGAQHMALRNIGLNFEIVGTSDWDINATLSYNEIHSKSKIDFAEGVDIEDIEQYLLSISVSSDGKKPLTEKQIERYSDEKKRTIYNAFKNVNNLGSIVGLNPEDVPDCDLFTYSFPCFVAGTLVYTDNGYKKIEDIQEGDMVLTHENRFKPVVIPMSKIANEIYELNAMGSEKLYVTKEHPFYTRKRYREYDGSKYENNKSKAVRKFKDPTWVNAEDLTKDDFLGVSVNNESKLPTWDGIDYKGPGGYPKHKNSIMDNKAFENEHFWWLVGRYIGDGWVRDYEHPSGKYHDERVVICCAKNETIEIESRLEKLEWLGSWSISEEGAVYKYHITNKEFKRYLDQFGHKAHGKHLTNDIYDLPVTYLRDFISGYFSADGSLDGVVYKMTTVSQHLVYGMARCINKAYKAPTSILKTIRPKTCVIEGRTVNQRDTYTLTFKKKSKKQDNAFYEDGYVWYPINDIKKQDDFNDYVYNMEVEDDNSYTVNNIIVHNCQAISLAGKQDGLEKGSGTSSSLLWECQKIIEAKKPKYLMMENVKNLVGKKFKSFFDEWVTYIDEQGYNTYWKVMNAKDYGIPQNRERVFAISVLKDYDIGYDFPKEFPLENRLKDLLETSVDEKFYISQDKVEKLLAKMPKPESLLWDQSMSGLDGKIRGYNEYSPSITAREYKDPRLIRVGNVNPSGNGMNGEVYYENGLAPTITTNKGEGSKVLQVGNIVDTGEWSNPQRGRIYSSDGLSPALNTVSGGGHEPKILIKNATKQGYLIAEDGDGVDLGYINMNTRRGRVQKQISHTITTQDSLWVYNDFRIRKLTPKECWRLMGFTDEDFFKAEAIHSNSTLYKQAGNSIVVNVLEKLFYNLFNDKYGQHEKQEKKMAQRPNKTIAVLDVETTGFSPISEEVTEIAVVLLDGLTGEEMGSFDTLIDIEGKIPNKIVELTGITNEMTSKYGMPKDMVATYLQEMLKDTIVVAHNVQFDFQFIKEHFGIVPKYYYDTLAISRSLYPSEKTHKLGVICERAGISLEGAHRAVNDTRATAELLNLQLNKEGVAMKYMNVIDSYRGVKYKPDNTREVL